MSDSTWTWRYETADGSPVEDATSQSFPTQSDAESWFGEVWHDLSAHGVASVTLHRDGQKVYGPMSLEGPA